VTVSRPSLHAIALFSTVQTRVNLDSWGLLSQYDSTASHTSSAGDRHSDHDSNGTHRPKTRGPSVITHRPARRRTVATRVRTTNLADLRRVRPERAYESVESVGSARGDHRCLACIERSAYRAIGHGLKRRTSCHAGLQLSSSRQCHLVFAPNNRWGLRGDYRFAATRSKDDAPAFFG